MRKPHVMKHFLKRHKELRAIRPIGVESTEVAENRSLDPKRRPKTESALAGWAAVSVSHRFRWRGSGSAARASACLASTAHAPTNTRERVWAASDETRGLKVASSDRAHIAPCVGVHRACVLAFDLPLPVFVVENFDIDGGMVHTRQHTTSLIFRFTPGPLPKDPAGAQAYGHGERVATLRCR